MSHFRVFLRYLLDFFFCILVLPKRRVFYGIAIFLICAADSGISLHVPVGKNISQNLSDPSGNYGMGGAFPDSWIFKIIKHIFEIVIDKYLFVY